MTYDFDRLIDRRRTDSQKWQTYGPDVLPLWIADMDFQSPEPVIRALRERVEHGVFGYLMFEQPEFHQLFADRLLKRYGWRVSPDAVVIIPGVIPGFNVAGRVLAASGDGLILQTPVYPPILRAAGNMGLTREEAPLARRLDGSYEVDVDAFAAAIRDRTRFFLLCNPHNPVGRVFRRDELQRLAEVCLRRSLTIVADEIHCELVYSGHRHTPIASLDPEIAERTITFMAPSKTFNLAGLKCAVAIIPNASLREKFVDARVDLVSTASRGWKSSCAISRPTVTSPSTTRARACPACGSRRPRRPISPGSTAETPGRPAPTRSPSSWTRRGSPCTTGSCSAPAARDSFGSTSAARARCSRRRSSACGGLSCATVQRASELIEVVVVVPGHHREELVDRAPPARIGVNRGWSIATTSFIRSRNHSSLSRRWQITSVAAQLFGAGRRARTSLPAPRTAAASSLGVRAIRVSRSSRGRCAYSSIVGMPHLRRAHGS